MGQFFADFIATAPDALRALYQFGDPAGLGRGWVGAAIMFLWLGPLGVLPLYVAKLTYGKHEWVSATMGIMGASSLLWWLHGVIPHGWIQFTESNRGLLEGTVIPASAGIDVSEDYGIDIASNLSCVITVGRGGGLMWGGRGVPVWGAVRMQRSYPKTLAAGETKPEAGGYK
ncbi:MAG: hypothetical protein JJT89_07025 [Nitriliruptoraceae bacterium]|nr:hypothetical protein [Nitriliruptoraceae bacterium]